MQTGDASVINPAQLIIATADGVRGASPRVHGFNRKRIFRINLATLYVNK